MTQRVNQEVYFKGGIIVANKSDQVLVPATGVVMDDKSKLPRVVRFTLAGFAIAVPAANDYGGKKFCDLPNRNLTIIGAAASLTLVKGGVTNGLVATTDLKVGVGTAVASAIPIATTMQNVINLADVTTDALSVTFAKNANANGTPANIFVAAGSSNSLYLNVSATGGITADDTLTASGWIDIYYIDNGA